MRSDLEQANKGLENAKKASEIHELEKKKRQTEHDRTVAYLKDELENANQSQKRAVEGLQKDIMNLKEQLGEVKSSNLTKDGEIQNLKATLEQLTKGNQSNKGVLSTLEAQVKELKTTLDIKNDQIQSLKSIQASLTSELAEKSKECTEMGQKLRTAEERVKVLMEKVRQGKGWFYL